MSNMGEGAWVVKVWDAPTRSFHWINAISVLTLMGFGLVILNAGSLGVGDDGKVLLKTLHVWVGYVFVANLLARMIWAFFGNAHARWSNMLPGGRGYLGDLGRYTAAFVKGRPPAYAGHSPLGRMAVLVLLLVLGVQGLTGLVLAGTDIYYPPFGHAIATWVAAPGVDPGDVAPYRPELVNPAAYEAMRDFRAPFIATHEFLFYLLAALVVVHIAAVVVTEQRGGGTLVSAMLTGRKVLFGTPLDRVRDAGDGEEARAPNEAAGPAAAPSERETRSRHLAMD